jgi:hypothetical protein
MARQLFFAITLIGSGMLFHLPAEAAMDAARCEDQFSNCVGRCHNPGGGTFYNKCMNHCSNRQITRCLARAHSAASWR